MDFTKLAILTYNLRLGIIRIFLSDIYQHHQQDILASRENSSTIMSSTIGVDNPAFETSPGIDVTSLLEINLVGAKDSFAA